MSTNVNNFFGELNQGLVEAQLSHMLSDTAASVMEHDGKGKITITLDLKKIKNSSQVNITHTLKYSRPTKDGSKQEDVTNSTPMYVSPDGDMSFVPAQQRPLFKDADQTSHA